MSFIRSSSRHLKKSFQSGIFSTVSSINVPYHYEISGQDLPFHEIKRFYSNKQDEEQETIPSDENTNTINHESKKDATSNNGESNYPPWRDGKNFTSTSHLYKNFLKEAGEGLPSLEKALGGYINAYENFANTTITFTEDQKNQIVNLYIRACIASNVWAFDFSFWFHQLFLGSTEMILKKDRKVKSSETSTTTSTEPTSTEPIEEVFPVLNLKKSEAIISKYKITGVPNIYILANILQYSFEHDRIKNLYYYFGSFQKLYPEIFNDEVNFAKVMSVFAKENQNKSIEVRERAGIWVYNALMCWKSVSKGSFVSSNTSYYAGFITLSKLNTPKRAFRQFLEYMKRDSNFVVDPTVLAAIIRALLVLEPKGEYIPKEGKDGKIRNFTLEPTINFNLVEYIRSNNISLSEKQSQLVVQIYQKLTDLPTTYKTIKQFYQVPEEILKIFEEPSEDDPELINISDKTESIQQFPMNSIILRLLLQSASKYGHTNRTYALGKYLEKQESAQKGTTENAVLSSYLLKGEKEKAFKYIGDHFNYPGRREVKKDENRVVLNRYNVKLIIDTLCTEEFPIILKRKEQYEKLYEYLTKLQEERKKKSNEIKTEKNNEQV